MRKMSDRKNVSFIDDYSSEKEVPCDATMVSKDGASFRVHSAVLMACSNFFKDVFEFVSGEGGKEIRAVLPNVNADVLVVILRFTYLKEIELNCSNVWKILLAADFLQIDLLSQACCDFMKKNLSLPTSVKLIEMTQCEIFMPAVQRMATTFALHNLCKPSYRLRGQQKAALAQMRPETLRSLLQDDELNAPREQDVWQAVVEWLEAEPEQRAFHLDAILATVRFGLMSKTFVSRNVLGHPVVQSRPELVRKVQELDSAVDRVLSTEISENSEIPVVARPRLPHTVVLAVGGRVNGAPSLEMQLYDINADAWIKVPALESSNPEQTMDDHGLAWLDDDLYVIGGTASGAYTTRCLKLNLRTFKWEVIASLSKRRALMSVVTLNGRIYAIGGRYNRRSSLRNFSAECYDPKTNKWHWIARMHHRRSSAGYTVFGGKIYVVGGFTGKNSLASSEVYDPQQNTWELLPNMKTSRYGHQCVTLGKYIYAIGGFSRGTTLASVERFDPDLRIWIPTAPMLKPSGRFGATVVGDQILAVGGCNFQSDQDSNQVYNVFEDKWHTLSPLPFARSSLKMVSIEDSPDLAMRLLTLNRAIPKLIKTDRKSHRPEYGTRLSPHAEATEGHLRSLPSEDGCWQEDELGLAISANQNFLAEPVEMVEDESKEEPPNKKTRFQ